MGRRVFIFLTGISTTLFALICVSGVVSYFDPFEVRRDIFRTTAPGGRHTTLGFYSTAGSFYFYRTVNETDDDRLSETLQWIYPTNDSAVTAHSVSRRSPLVSDPRWGWSYGVGGVAVSGVSNVMTAQAGTLWTRQIWFVTPHSVAAALTLMLPLLRLWRWWTRRGRASHGLCPKCGYDLRATPERCPECGTAA